MNVQQEKLLDFLAEGAGQLRIPVFQRPYSWGADQCGELWRDVCRAGKGSLQHFAGPLIYMPAEGGARYIVDGQQRLITVSLLIMALAERIEASGGADGVPGASALRSILLMPPGEGVAQPRLTLSAADNAAFSALVLNKPSDRAGSARVLDNLDFFRSALSRDEASAEQLWRGLRGLYVLLVELDAADDEPQGVFESLNSKGVQLTTADLCRNYLLSALPSREQERLYEEYWEPIEDLFGDDPGSLRLNNAILGWLTVRFRRIRAKGDRQAFGVFKRYMQEEYRGSLEELLGELYSFCSVWAENYRYHAVKAYKSAANWATLGAKTLVSDRPLKPVSDQVKRFYAQYFGINVKW